MPVNLVHMPDFDEMKSSKYAVSGSYLYHHYMQDDFNDNVTILTTLLWQRWLKFRVGDVPIEACRLSFPFISVKG